MSKKESQRYPLWVFDEGTDPDPRFSLANERTFLAWVRTSMAFIAAGIAFHAVNLPIAPSIKLVVSIILLLTGILIPPFAWLKRAFTERSMRRKNPLPNSLIEEWIMGIIVTTIGILLGIGLYLG